MDNKEIARTGKRLRERMGPSQEKSAAEVGVTASTVNRWEKDRGTPSPFAIKQIETLRRQLEQ